MGCQQENVQKCLDRAGPRGYRRHMTGKLLTATRVAEHLGIARQTLYVWIDSGRFPVEPAPGTKPRRWRLEELNAWVNGADSSAPAIAGGAE